MEYANTSVFIPKGMRVLYNILVTLFLLVTGPFYLMKMWRRGNWMAGFGQRFGRFSSKIKQAITNRQALPRVISSSWPG